MKTQKFNLTEQGITKSNRLANELIGEINQSLTLEENIKAAIEKRIPIEDAGEIAAQLLSGIHKFDEAYEKAKKGEWDADYTLSAALADKTNAEKYSSMLNILTALANNEESGKDPILTEYLKKAEDTENIKEGEHISDEEVSELQNLLSEYINEFALSCFSDETSAVLLDELGKEAADDIAGLVWNENAKPYLALSIYILQVKGELLEVPIDMTPEEIGASVAAAIEKDTVIRGFAAGKTTWEKTLQILKTIAKVILAVILVIALAKLGYVVGGAVFVLTKIIVGMGVIGTAIALIAGLAAGKKVIDFGMAVYAKSVEYAGVAFNKLKEAYMKVNDWVNENITPKLKSFWEKCKALISNILHLGNNKADENEKANVYEDKDENENENENEGVYNPA